MASLTYNSCFDDLVRGNINFASDTFWIMLVTASYVADKDLHVKRSDITNEVSGTGYSAGGKVITATITKDTANDRIDIDFSSVNWPTASITARGGVIYKRRGGAATADELVAYIDFGANVTSTNDTFTVTLSSPLRLQN